MADEGKGKQSKFSLIMGAVDNFSATFKNFDDKIAKTTTGLGKMQAAVGNFNSATGLSRLAGAVGNVSGGMKNVVGEGKALVGTVTGLVGKATLLFGATGGGLFALAKSTANAGDAATKSAQRAGVAIELWQEYAHAADLADLSQEKLIKGFAGLQDAAKKAAGGSKAQAGAFKALGINPKTIKGEVKTADTLFGELADKVQALQAAGKGAEAVNLLGDVLGDRDAREFIPMLSAGKQGLLEARQEAHKLGMVLSAEDGKASEAFNDNLSRMFKALQGVGYTIGRLLLPPLTALAEKFTNWIATNRELIATGLEKWIKKLDVNKIWQGFENLIAKLQDLWGTVSKLADAFGGWENVLLALAAVISGKFLLSIGGLIASFGKLAFAIMTTPVGWFIAACAAIGGAVYAIYKNWDKIVAYFQGLWQGVKDAFSRNWLEGIVTFLVNFNPVRIILDAMNGLIEYLTGFNLKEAGIKLIDSFAVGISAEWDKFVGWFKDKIKWVTDIWAKVKGFFGYGDDDGEMTLTDDTSGSYASSGMAAPLNMAPAARGVMETRSEHVEKNEVLIKVEAKDGASAQVSGYAGAGVPVQNGQLMFGAV